MLIISIYTERPYIPLLEIYKVFFNNLCSIGGKWLSIVAKLCSTVIEIPFDLIKKTNWSYMLDSLAGMAAS